jgi:carboxypeptidase T
MAAPSYVLFKSTPIESDSEFDVRLAAMERPSMLIDAAHHARELTSVSQVMYTLIRVLHGYLNNDEQVRNLLSSGAIYWLPVVNYDGYAKISSAYASSKQLLYIRKN